MEVDFDIVMLTHFKIIHTVAITQPQLLRVVTGKRPVDAVVYWKDNESFIENVHSFCVVFDAGVILLSCADQFAVEESCVNVHIRMRNDYLQVEVDDFIV